MPSVLHFNLSSHGWNGSCISTKNVLIWCISSSYQLFNQIPQNCSFHFVKSRIYCYNSLAVYVFSFSPFSDCMFVPVHPYLLITLLCCIKCHSLRDKRKFFTSSLSISFHCTIVWFRQCDVSHSQVLEAILTYTLYKNSYFLLVNCFVKCLHSHFLFKMVLFFAISTQLHILLFLEYKLYNHCPWSRCIAFMF